MAAWHLIARLVNCDLLTPTYCIDAKTSAQAPHLRSSFLSAPQSPHRRKPLEQLPSHLSVIDLAAELRGGGMGEEHRRERVRGGAHEHRERGPKQRVYEPREEAAGDGLSDYYAGEVANEARSRHDELCDEQRRERC
eukprot:CAMPEP_0185264932 /NCGR_PEP_ID=MMETSP1359-20130426/25468_1 /TAXON_ID=552665 /ORGANISM="Bigelowiella longifila, Strain CCMP242" /LENGTH=136 /DNA_ID=CAMNT_0027853855 /DNA_START=31 /DNA_END=442 /DNA_ORIENTATION=+